ncbi:hypothetical protein C4588_08010 [Candidatus Parcubacteria bacterium]|nr:MAG: hypothetical protein C4588_08010 [Candidatus Parcubacteria bacterium]
MKDKDKGVQYRYYTGVDIDNVPTEATLHNFRDRIGEGKLQEVINFLVQIFNIVGIISGRILCTDGTLIKAFARYRGFRRFVFVCDWYIYTQLPWVIVPLNAHPKGKTLKIPRNDTWFLN